ncbi:GAF domain-containing protein [Mesobacillus persicus]|uniref:GAF domain-containing protein n=1 Tax=Mesobacillus persicus TaxID=930146 RepID=A0A1H8DE83_9BACI|nr:helix-turn-helix domain-containing protein [Mesobacillus persicus]SEN04838.1 GAF domain-containing protein [Mesobacillus persicus]
MYNQKLLQSYLLKLGVRADYHIWLTSPEMEDFVLIDQTGECIANPPSQQSLDQIYILDVQDGNTYFYFNYPGDYQVVICLNQELRISDDDFEVLYHFLYPCYADYSLRASQFKIDKIIENIRHTTSVLDVEDLFSSILANTIEVIPNADLGTLWLYKPEIDRFVCKASYGNLFHGIRQMQFKDDEGFIGYSFKRKTPELFTNIVELTSQDVWTASPDNNQYWDKRIDLSKSVKSMLTAPIMIDDRVECVIILCQIKTKTTLTDQDLQLLQGFSSQVGIVLKNAKLFSDLKRQNELLLKRDDIHTTLTNLSLQSMGVNKVIRELTRMIGLTIFFVDLIQNECIPETKGLTDNPSFKELYNYLNNHTNQRESSSYILTQSKTGSHYLYPIRSGNVILGCIIIRAQRPLEQMDRIALETGHSILALQLVKKQTLVEFYYKKKRELFNEIIQVRETEELQQKARELGIKEHTNLVSVLFEFSGFTDPLELETHVHRLISQMKIDLSPTIQTVFGHNNEVTVLACVKTPSDLLTFKKKINQMIADWTSMEEILLNIGMGSIYDGLHLIEKSYLEAKKALSYLRSRKRSGFIQYSEIGVNRLFINQNEEEILEFVMQVFEPLRTTQGNNNSLEQTLLAYFDCNRSATQTAKKLHIHINTLYLRLKKIEESLQISLENPEHVLRIQLACYLIQSYEKVENK